MNNLILIFISSVAGTTIAIESIDTTPRFSSRLIIPKKQKKNIIGTLNISIPIKSMSQLMILFDIPTNIQGYYVNYSVLPLRRNLHLQQ